MPRKFDQHKLSKKDKTNLRNAKIQQFLPCFFDVPAAEVQDILGISHHTLDPARRSLGLQKWPFVDVSRNQFCMTAVEISSLRTKMMCIADDEMHAILVQMSQKAEECKSLLEHRRRLRVVNKKQHRSGKTTITGKTPPASRGVPNEELGRLIECNMQLVQQTEETLLEQQAPPAPILDDLQLQELIDNASITNDTQFWTEISQLLAS